MLTHSWILNLVSPLIAQSIMIMGNLVNVWKDLRERFAQRDLVKKIELMQEIYALQQDSKYLTNFYSKLTIL